MKPLARPLGVVFDCADTEALARFWQGIVGGTIDSRTASPTWLSLDSVDGFVKLSFQKVPEGKAVKNRVHLDLDVDHLDTAVKTAVVLVRASWETSSRSRRIGFRYCTTLKEMSFVSSCGRTAKWVGVVGSSASQSSGLAAWPSWRVNLTILLACKESVCLS